jgi:hypothetical protein
MKKNIFIYLLLLPFVYAKAQFTANAGSDIHSCDMDANANSIIIGGNPSALNGTPPYTYSWSINPIEFGFPGSGLFFHASNILNDSSLANPSLIDRYVAPFVVFYLKVSDANGLVSYDTSIVSFSNFMQHLQSYSWAINSGDSAFIDVGSNVGGGVGTLSYLWQPSNSISDSTSEFGFWAKPVFSTNYYVTVIDSMGCERTGTPFCMVNVNSVGIENVEKMINSNTINVFPNPTNDILNISYTMLQNGNASLQLFNSLGQIVKEVSNQQAIGTYTLNVDTKSFANGIYYIRFSDGVNTKQAKVIVQ